MKIELKNLPTIVSVRFDSVHLLSYLTGCLLNQNKR